MLSLCSCARRSTSRIFLIDTLFVGIGCPPLFLLTEVADQLTRVSTGAMPARLSPAVRDHRNDCPEIDWIECPQVALNLHPEDCAGTCWLPRVLRFCRSIRSAAVAGRSSLPPACSKPRVSAAAAGHLHQPVRSRTVVHRMHAT